MPCILKLAHAEQEEYANFWSKRKRSDLWQRELLWANFESLGYKKGSSPGPGLRSWRTSVTSPRVPRTSSSDLSLPLVRLQATKLPTMDSIDNTAGWTAINDAWASWFQQYQQGQQGQ